MRTVGPFQSEFSLEQQGILNLSAAYWNFSTPHLYEEAIRRREGNIAHLGPLVVRTGSHTGRSPNDKFIVREPSSEANIHWGKVNKAMEPEQFERLKLRLFAYLQSKDVFVQDCFAGSDPDYRMPIRIITEYAWHNLFARNLFIQARPEDLKSHMPEFTVIDAPNFRAIPEIDGTRSETFIVMNFAERTVLIGGTQYAGEMKKSIFTALNYTLPLQNVLPMHCSANVGPDGDVAVFFGLSGTGKTTLSADPSRKLIGDDEHGWSENGIFNFEGGCYAKIIRLSRESEPEIYETTRRFGTVLENVGFNIDTGRIDLNDDSLTENTRAAYPISHIPNAELSGRGTHPKNIIMLTADAFGVMPPISRLTPEQAMYQFLSGYTAKVAGTERGVTEPQATFSTCFGAPFMVHMPTVYASLLGDRIQRHNAKVWLVNTGWTGGPYGVGSRFKIEYTRAMINAALSGQLDDAETFTDPFFGLSVPKSCPGVPDDVLNPRSTWKSAEEYDRQALRLANMFEENFRQFSGNVSSAVQNAGPTAA